MVYDVLRLQLGLAMLTVYKDIPQIFREQSLINVDGYAVLLIIQGPISFWSDTYEDFFMSIPSHTHKYFVHDMQ